MGVTVSRGIDNESLMDKLLETQHTLPRHLERAMHLVDRGDYLEKKDGRTYADVAWRCGTVHLSTPSIYITVIKHLDLRPGLRFLNIGSGTGYLNTIVGLILGYSGVNHGIEVEPYNVTYANDHLGTFLSESNAPLERDFCIPTFVRGNILDLVLPVDIEAGPVTTHYASENQRPQLSDTPSCSEDTRSVLFAHGSAAESDSEDDGEQAQEEAEWVWDESIPIAPLPTYLLAKPGEGEGFEEFGWPAYDRVYVGAGVENRLHLQAMLSLVKVGGILIAPLEDHLIKLTRVSAQRTTCERLSSVSYAPLVLPGRRGEAREPFPSLPPGNAVPTLSQLTARCLRGRLCRVIERHHQGPPTIGRLQEVKPSDKAVEASGDTVSNAGHCSSTPPDPRPSRLARILHHIQLHLLDRKSPQREPSGSTEEAVEGDSGCSVSEHGSTEPDGQELSRTGAMDQHHVTSDPTTVDDTSGQDDKEARLEEHSDESSGEHVVFPYLPHGPDGKAPVYLYIEPNYRYRDEIRRILRDRMNLPEACVRMVLRF